MVLLSSTESGILYSECEFNSSGCLLALAIGSLFYYLYYRYYNSSSVD